MKGELINRQLYSSRKHFVSISPGAPHLLKISKHRKVFKLAIRSLKMYRYAKQYQQGKAISTLTGEYLGNSIIYRSMSPVKKTVVKGHHHVIRTSYDLNRKNGVGGRSWITRPGQYDLIMIYHDANRAGPHIDVHIGKFSLIYRVKPDLYKQLRYNSDGQLTQNSRDLIIKHVRSEIANGSRVPQNLDHSKKNAHAEWFDGDTRSKEYGSGKTRQIVLETKVDVLKAHENGPIEFYAPAINSHRTMYIYRLYEGSSKRAPILVWGNKQHHAQQFDDRLHLKLMHPEQMDKVVSKVDMSTSTAKYDGSSCYFIITPKGTTVWSPRHSKVTNEPIEYTFKVNAIANVRSDETIVGMGELLFKPKSRNPFAKTEYFSQAISSGILNNNQVIPTNVQPEIRIYRIDKIGHRKVGNLDFWENREIQEEVSSLDPKRLKVVELMDPETAMTLGYEGFVAVPEGMSVNDGVKVKWWQDPNDWRIDKIEFKPGDKGGIAGVVWLTSLESGKTFKLGPGQIGDRSLTEAMMNDPDLYVGSVVKVNSRRGHEGRGSVLLGFHDDKGEVILKSDHNPYAVSVPVSL